MKRVLPALGLCLFIAAPYSAVAGQKADAMKPLEAENIQMDIAMSASMPHNPVAGTAIPLKVRVQNWSKGNVEFLPHLMTASDYDLQLLDARGQPVPLTRFGKRAETIRRVGGSSILVTLEPGKNTEDTLNLARIFDLTVAGEYTLRIRRELEGVNLQIEGMKFQVLEGP